jgi:hypothetical protein
MGIEKVVLGAILVVIGLWLILPSSWCQALWSDFSCLGWYVQFISVLKGLLPGVLIFIGAILVWIESEELKLERPKRKR